MTTQILFAVSGVVLAYAVTRDAAVAISTFAKRPVIWGSETIGIQYA